MDNPLSKTRKIKAFPIVSEGLLLFCNKLEADSVFS
jgi:hypothetical protein